MQDKKNLGIKRIFWILSILIYSSNSSADVQYMSLKEAEHLALGTSNTLKAMIAQANAAEELSGSQFAALLPQWTLDGQYQYNTLIPTFTIPNTNQNLAVGVHTPYSVTTTIGYTIWDNFSNLNAYKSSEYLANSQKEIASNTKIDILTQARLSYMMVQLGIREFRAAEDSLKLAQSQFDDIDKRYKAGAIANLDWIDSQRSLLSYELQYEKQRSNVETKVKDLFALLNLSTDINVFPDDKNTLKHNTDTTSDSRYHSIPAKLTINFDSLESALERAQKWEVVRPPESQPKLQSQLLLVKSYNAQADSEFAKLFPKIDVFASAQILYPNMIELKPTNQNSFGATLTMPIFDGLRILHNTAAAKQNAMMSQFNHDQIRINFDRDYEKYLEVLKSLQLQKEINAQDIIAAKKSAELYYESYKSGKSLLINVQRANLQVFTSEVEGARISAEMLQQLYQLQYLSGKINL